MKEMILTLVEAFGAFGILILSAAENVFPPIPSEVLLPFGGFLTTCTSLKIIPVILAATVGTVLGAIILYGAGRLLGRERLEKILSSRIGRILHFKPEHVARAEAWFLKRGNKAVFFCRFVPIVRSLISIPAGMAKMPMAPFLLFTAIGTGIWNIVLVFLGALAGRSWEVVSEYMGVYSKIVLRIFLIIGMLFFLVYAYRKWKKRKLEKAGQKPQPENGRMRITPAVSVKQAFLQKGYAGSDEGDDGSGELSRPCRQIK